MNAIVLYESKRGSTARYAEWIAEDLGCTAIPVGEADAGAIIDCDVIIFGGWLRGSGIVGIDKFKSALAAAGTDFERIADKLIIFVTGISVYNPANHMQICEINFPEAAKGAMDMSKIKLYFCPGAYDLDKVKGIDKMMMRISRSVLKGGRTKDGAGDADMMIDRIDRGVDLVDRKYTEPVIRAARRLQ